jgi:hypothetical protein
MQDPPPNGSVYSRSLGQSWLGQYPTPISIPWLTRPPALPAKTRLFLSLGFCAVAAAGMFVSDQLEKKYPAQMRDEEKK